MFSSENDLSSISNIARQNALDYLKREIDFAHELHASYILVVPGAVGRAKKYDDYEFNRSVETVRKVGDLFLAANVKAAIEPIRAAEVSFCHTISDAQKYIAAVDHSGISHINGDVYHMQSGESHIGEALLKAGDKLINLHLADSNRSALGLGSMDYDTIIKALYILQSKKINFFVSAEPLGPGGDPYPAMHCMPDSNELDAMVSQSINYFRSREKKIIEEK